MKKLAAIFTAMILCLPQQALALYENETSLRGAEQEEAGFLDPFGDSVSALTYLPRQVLNGAFYGAGKTAAVLSDKDFIRRVKDILYFYDERALWYPIVSYASGFRAAYGAGLLYKDRGVRVHTRALLHDSNFWSYSFKPSYTADLGGLKWKNSLLGVLEKKDDRRFYGIGADPHNDPRNTFLGSNDYGVYTEERRKIQWSSKLSSPSSPFSVEYLGYYQRRAFEDHGMGVNDVREVFDHSRIPGFDAPVKQLYNELSLEIDTRKNTKMLTPGFRGEVYSGVSAGFGKHDANLFRTGFDAAGFIPFLHEHRLIVPRLVADMVENMNEQVIPFSEYPRQRTFRGNSAREIIRSERVSIVPSIEYQWPLSHMLNAHLFFDTLFVGQRPAEIDWNQGLWAAGGGIDLHYLNRELGRFELAGGSEGFQATFTVGNPLKTNHRKDW